MSDTINGTLTSRAVTTFGTSADALSNLLGHFGPASPLVIIDLQTVPDAEQFIGFLKSSELRDVAIAAVGTPDDYKALSTIALASLTARFPSPLGGADLALFAAAFSSRKPLVSGSRR